MAICPICKVNSVKKRFTWYGILCGLLCFPCGIYCCIKDRVWFCPLCTNEICYSDGREPSFNRNYHCYKSFRKVGDSGSREEQNQTISGSQRNAIGSTVSPVTSSNGETISGPIQ